MGLEQQCLVVYRWLQVNIAVTSLSGPVDTVLIGSPWSFLHVHQA